MNKYVDNICDCALYESFYGFRQINLRSVVVESYDIRKQP